MYEKRRLEIDHRMIKLLIGIIAITLANATSIFSHHTILSISESYHYGGWARDVFVGSLFAIATFMAAYNGFSQTEMLLSKAAAVAALSVAMFPCECGFHDEVIPKVHAISAATMFLILALLCYVFYQRAMKKRNEMNYEKSVRRAWIYIVCGVLIILSIITLVVDYLLSGAIINKIPRLVFYCERTGLIAFGIAWLSASHIFPFITDDQERWSPIKPSHQNSQNKN